GLGITPSRLCALDPSWLTFGTSRAFTPQVVLLRNRAQEVGAKGSRRRLTSESNFGVVDGKSRGLSPGGGALGMRPTHPLLGGLSRMGGWAPAGFGSRPRRGLRVARSLGPHPGTRFPRRHLSAAGRDRSVCLAAAFRLARPGGRPGRVSRRLLLRETRGD